MGEFPDSLLSPEPLSGEGRLSKEDLIAGEDRKLIPEGKYSAQCIEAKRGMVGQKTNKGTSAIIPKIVLLFRVIDGEHEGKELPMYINAAYKPFPPGSKYYQIWSIASGRKPARKDRMPLDVFKNHIFTVAVTTVKPKSPDGTDVPEALWYSRVDWIYEKCA